MAKQDDYVRYTIRVPADLYAKLQKAADAKSINAEIIDRLGQSFAVPLKIGPQYQKSLARASDAEIAELQEGLEDLLNSVFPTAVLEIDPLDHWRSTMEVYKELPAGLRAKWKADTLRICRLLAKDPNWLPPAGEE